MDFIRNPVSICRKIFEYIHEMTVLIRGRLERGGSGRRQAQDQLAVSLALL